MGFGHTKAQQMELFLIENKQAPSERYEKFKTSLANKPF